jgi:GR25 family glycosyltransferase involved in LPS biosynthesis
MLVLLLLSKNKFKKKNNIYYNKFIKNNNLENNNNDELNNDQVNNDQVNNDAETNNDQVNNDQVNNDAETNNDQVTNNDEVNNNELTNDEGTNNDKVTNNDEVNNDEVTNNEVTNDEVNNNEVTNNNELNNDKVNNDDVNNNEINEYNSKLEYYNKINDNYKLENNIDNRINYFIIHIFNPDNLRFNNIELMRDKLGKCINICDGVKGSSVHINSEKKIIMENNKLPISNIYEPSVCYLHPGEIGCYLSHVLIFETIKEDNGYTCIFEDDFIIEDNLDIKIKEIIDKIDYNFDILYLGNLNYNCGSNYIDNIYYVNYKQDLWGTHGYIIKNNNVKKLLLNLLIIDNAIDQKLKILINKEILNGLVIFPPIVSQNTSYKSTIDRWFKIGKSKKRHPKYILFLLNRK